MKSAWLRLPFACLMALALLAPAEALSSPQDDGAHGALMHHGRKAKKKHKRKRQKAVGRSSAAKFRGSSWGGPSTSGR